jgi:hypothetical protein
MARRRGEEVLSKGVLAAFAHPAQALWVPSRSRVFFSQRSLLYSRTEIPRHTLGLVACRSPPRDSATVRPAGGSPRTSAGRPYLARRATAHVLLPTKQALQYRRRNRLPSKLLSGNGSHTPLLDRNQTL